MIPEYWGSYLDYSPYTKISAMLPFVGSVTLNTDEVMNKQIGLRYRIDLLSGACVAMITVNGTVYYQYTGECGIAIPLTGSDWSRVYSAITGAVITAGVGVAGAVSSGAAAGAFTSANSVARSAEAAGNAGLAYAMINDTSKGVRGVAQMRNDMQAASQLALSAGQQAANAGSTVASSIRATRIAGTVGATVDRVMSAKGIVQHSSGLSGSAAMLGVRTPYVMIEYPNQSLPTNYAHFVGYPSNISGTLSNFSGYTECEQVIASGVTGATDNEMSELIDALKNGVYL